MTLEMLVEEQRSIKTIIDEKIASMKKWFEDKIEETKDIFAKVKDKVLELFTKNVDKSKLNAKVGKDIEVEKDGKKVKFISKNDTIATASAKIKSQAKSQLNEVKRLGDKAIGSCQKGIRLLMGIKDEDLEKDKVIREVHKNKVSAMDILLAVGTVAKAINATCSAYRVLLLIA